MNVFPELANIGFIQKSIGFKGQLLLQLEVEALPNGNYPKYLWFLQYGKPVPFQVLSYKQDQLDRVILTLEDIDEEHAAIQLKGLSCFVEESVYNEYYESIESYDYLFEFVVIDKTDGLIGKVIDVLESENGHDNLVVLTQDEQEVLIPFVDSIVDEMNEEKQEILVNLPEGLLDLYLN